jgi:hypothetical protein
MATVHSEAGFTFRIWPNGHAPAHVHAWKAGAVAVIELEPVAVREVKGPMKAADVVRAVRMVEANLGKLKNAWRQIHGK